MLILISTYYTSSNEDRNIELQKCLINNLNNDYISKIYLLNNEIFDLSFLSKHNKYDFTKKIEQIIISNNPKYILSFKDAIHFINVNLINNICILSNSDIYFDNTLSYIKKNDMNNKLYALLRYDEDENGNKTLFSEYNEPRKDSQDSWIFKSPLKINLDKIDFSFGTLGCDNIFARHVYDNRIIITNPSYDIVTTHLHNTNYRTYNIDNRLYGIYCLLIPCKLNEYPKPLFIDY